jgi:hypothetical protein
VPSSRLVSAVGTPSEEAWASDGLKRRFEAGRARGWGRISDRMDGDTGGQRITRGVVLGLFLFALGAGATLAAALSPHLTAPTASATAYVVRDEVWSNEWEDRLETGVPGVMFIPPDIPPPPPAVATAMAKEIERPEVAGEVIGRLGLQNKMTPDELLKNLSVTPHRESIAISYRDPSSASESPDRARRVVRTVAAVASERIRKETPYIYAWVLFFPGEKGNEKGEAIQSPPPKWGFSFLV